MQSDVLITGMGIISALGNNVDENLVSLKLKKSGIGNIKHLDTKHKNEFKVGEVNLSNPQMLDKLDISTDNYKKYTRTSLLGIIAAKEAFYNAGLNKEDLKLRIGVISATTVGGMDKTETDYFSKNYKSGFIHTHPSGDPADKIADFLKITGYRTTLTTACSSAANAIIHGAGLIKHNIVDIVLAGGTDALCKFTLNGFNSLMILDKNPCKPFDKDRQGLNLGEGAGFLVMESDKSAAGRGVTPLCKLSGYANANDAYHQTASSPEGEGAYISMLNALKMSKFNPDDIDYINAHGTGTNNNDLSEGIAIKRIFENKIPPFGSTKSFTGHTLGAAAAVEAVISILAIKHGMIYPNLNFKNLIDELNLSPETDLKMNVKINNVLSNSFGFGGNNSTLVFSKYE